MSRNQSAATISLREAAALFADPHWATKYPLILSLDQAAELLQVPKSTLYGWSSQDRLDDCKMRAGKHLRLLRDRLVQNLVEGKLNGDER